MSKPNGKHRSRVSPTRAAPPKRAADPSEKDAPDPTIARQRPAKGSPRRERPHDSPPPPAANGKEPTNGVDANANEPAPLEVTRLAHELQVHQEELEIQNRQLVESQRLLEDSRDRYANLYDF